MEIREKWVAGKLTQKQLAEEYGVTQAVISNRIRYSILVDGPREKSPHGRPRLGGFFKSKLTREQVLEIRERYAAGGVMQKDLAAEYGVSSTTLHRCLRSYLIADDPRAEAAYTTFHRKRDGWKG